MDKIFDAIKSFFASKKESVTCVTIAQDKSGLTQVDNRVNAKELIKQYNPYQSGCLICDQCGNNVSKTYTTTTPKNALTQETKVVCEYCFCTQLRKNVSVIEGELYNSLRAKYNLSRKYFPRLINM